MPRQLTTLQLQLDNLSITQVKVIVVAEYLYPHHSDPTINYHIIARPAVADGLLLNQAKPIVTVAPVRSITQILWPIANAPWMALRSPRLAVIRRRVGKC